MGHRKGARLWIWLLAAGAGALAGFAAYQFILAARDGAPAALGGPPPEVEDQRAGGEAGFGVDVEGVALAYARAYMQADWDAVIGATLWMQDRLEYVRLRDGAPEAVHQAREDLRAQLRARTRSEARWCEEGLEDKYVFAPDAQVEPVLIDAGRDGLHAPVAGRVWLRVVYPDEALAPRDRRGRRVLALLAGVNVGLNGKVLKAAIIGNVEVPARSMRVEPVPASKGPDTARQRASDARP